MAARTAGSDMPAVACLFAVYAADRAGRPVGQFGERTEARGHGQQRDVPAHGRLHGAADGAPNRIRPV
ncbi:hypothetical protein CUT44_05665 [Streptomyces carminius]|uniref:Uncharacterized protein n=1 Tax=Streptomyces carminius TaxID=2665496 RepID=A0A2M8M4W0_9ACTN|nr:hypothetical protein CUT44_05665 [Streptomyces carminius]